MLKIRLQRVGKKHSPHFRLVAVDSRRAPRSGASLEILGSYDGRQHKLQCKRERIKFWLSEGAQMSQRVKSLLKNAKIELGSEG